MAGKRGVPKSVSALVTVDGNQQFVFDVHAVRLGGFTLRARSAKPVGRPSLAQWEHALVFASATHDASPYWIGDLLAYGESREDWREKLSQAQSVTSLAEQTLHNLGYVSRRVQEHERQLAPTVAHAAEVAPLARPEQTEWLTKAREEGWTVRDLRLHMRAARRRKVLEGQATLTGQFRVILADPPWQYGDSGVIQGSAYGKAEAHYEGLTMEDIAQLPVSAHVEANAVLFLWVTSPMLMLHPGPRDVLEAWGFCYKSSFVWNKVLGNFGHYNHVQHEFLLVCTRGSCLPDVPTPQPKSVITIRRSDEHSAKPEAVREMIMRHWTRGPYLELFASTRVEGWVGYGNDARLWASETGGVVARC